MRISRALLAISLGGAILAGLGAPASASTAICVGAIVNPILVSTGLGSVSVGGDKNICV